jgi:hypothetical protein
MDKPSDRKAHAFDIFEAEGGWGVLLADYIPNTDDVATAVFFPTKEEALAFVAEHAPRNG